jgi:hypothetical protein
MDVEVLAGETGFSPPWRGYFQICGAPVQISRQKVRANLWTTSLRVTKTARVVQAGEELHGKKAVFLNLLNIAHLR